QRPSEGILSQLLLRNAPEPVELLAHVHRLRGQEDARACGNAQHSRPLTGSIAAQAQRSLADPRPAREPRSAAPPRDPSQMTAASARCPREARVAPHGKLTRCDLVPGPLSAVAPGAS